jgi:hypothetical protein
MHREGWVEARKAGHKMVIPKSDGPFGSILSVVVRGHNLKIDLLGAHEGFERRGALVVQLLKLGFETACGQMLVQLGVGAEEFLFAAVFDWFSKDGC